MEVPFLLLSPMRHLKTGEPTHATPHINNLIRNGLGQLNKDERDKLDEIGLRIVGNRITTMDPVLDQTYDTEHLDFIILCKIMMQLRI